MGDRVVLRRALRNGCEYGTFRKCQFGYVFSEIAFGSNTDTQSILT